MKSGTFLIGKISGFSIGFVPLLSLGTKGCTFRLFLPEIAQLLYICRNLIYNV